jgi:hypothetical protein
MYCFGVCAAIVIPYIKMSYLSFYWSFFFVPALIGSHVTQSTHWEVCLYHFFLEFNSQVWSTWHPWRQIHAHILVQWVCCHCHSEYQDVILIILLELFCTGFNGQLCYTLHTLEGLSKIFNSQTCNSHFRDTFSGFSLPLYWFSEMTSTTSWCTEWQWQKIHRTNAFD